MSTHGPKRSHSKPELSPSVREKEERGGSVAFLRISSPCTSSRPRECSSAAASTCALFGTRTAAGAAVFSQV